MKKNNTTNNATVNPAQVVKEETTMKKTNVHAADYLSKDKIREELKALGIELSNSKFKNTKREVLLEMLEAKKTETAPVADTTKPAMPIAPISAPATHQVICTDHAYYNDEYVAFTGTQKQCEEYVNENFTEENARLGLCSYTITPAGVPVGDLPGTMDNTPSNDISKESEVLPETVAETVSAGMTADEYNIFYGTNRMNGILYYAARNTENLSIISAYMLASICLEYVSGKSANKWKDILDKDATKANAYNEAVNKASTLRDSIVEKYLTVYTKNVQTGEAKTYFIKNLVVYRFESTKTSRNYLVFEPGKEFIYLVTNDRGYLKLTKQPINTENVAKLKATCKVVEFGGDR